MSLASDGLEVLFAVYAAIMLDILVFSGLEKCLVVPDAIKCILTECNRMLNRLFFPLLLNKTITAYNLTFLGKRLICQISSGSLYC